MRTQIFTVRTKKAAVGATALFLFLGAVCIVGPLYVLAASHVPSEWRHVNGTIIDVAHTTGTTKRPDAYNYYVKYDVQGRSYVVESEFGSMVGKPSGSQMDVAYDPADPSLAKTGFNSVDRNFMIILIVIGLWAVWYGIRGYRDYTRRHPGE